MKSDLVSPHSDLRWVTLPWKAISSVMPGSAFSRGTDAAQQLLSRSSILRRNVVLGYGVGLVAFIAALVLRFWLDATLPPGFPFLTFIPAVIISAFLAGSRAGLLCAALSFLSAWYWFIGEWEEFELNYGAAVALGFFTFISAVDIAIIEVVARAVDRLRWASEDDALTSLPNRRSFESHLKAASFRVMNKRGASLGLLLIDVDHFKHINDSLGHPAGDHVLKTFAGRLKKSLRAGDFVARLGGDEFAIILEHIGDEEDLLRVGQSILDRLQAPVQFDNRVICGSASIGGALFPRDATTADDLLKTADTALYALKASGRGGTKMFHSHMRRELQRVASQLNVARVALNAGSVIPHYQPKVNLRTGDTVGYEALLRWQHPTRGLQEPDSVAEAFKDFELASKIGELMQNKVFDDIVSWRRRGLEFGSVAINAAPVEFLRDDYAERLLARLESRQLPASLVEVEVTEHVFLERATEFVGRALVKLSEAGIRISLDDFGTGSSSLSHLRDFPVDVVKIDRSFVAQMVDNDEIASIVRAVIHLAHSLSIEVVAEGVETNEQMILLKVAGCTLGQGWLFGKPVSSDKILAPTSRAA